MAEQTIHSKMTFGAYLVPFRTNCDWSIYFHVSRYFL